MVGGKRRLRMTVRPSREVLSSWLACSALASEAEIVPSLAALAGRSGDEVTRDGRKQYTILDSRQSLAGEVARCRCTGHIRRNVPTTLPLQKHEKHKRISLRVRIERITAIPHNTAKALSVTSACQGNWTAPRSFRCRQDFRILILKGCC